MTNDIVTPPLPPCPRCGPTSEGVEIAYGAAAISLDGWLVGGPTWRVRCRRCGRTGMPESFPLAASAAGWGESERSPADDGRCVEGGASCAAVERAIGPEPAFWHDDCAPPRWLQAADVEVSRMWGLPSPWGPSTTAIPTHGRCG